MSFVLKMKETQRLARQKYKISLEVPLWKRVTFGAVSLKVHRSKNCIDLLYHIY